MAYDEHYQTSEPGTVSDQHWIQKVTDIAAAAIPPEKLILAIAGYGYDWIDGQSAQPVTYKEALALAKTNHQTIEFDTDTYNAHFAYSDTAGKHHQVYFMDAAGNYNTIRFSDDAGFAGTALWRFGSEDDRIWSFYGRDLRSESLQKNHFDYSELRSLTTQITKPDYIGDGEVLDIVTEPQPGKIQVEIDASDELISQEKYLDLPTEYVIRKFGNVHGQALLTFDDGPDPNYTPRILDILKQAGVPATFFVVGVNGESNLPLLQRIYTEGHEIGNHTFTHPNMAAVSSERAESEIQATRLLIEAAVHHSTVLFRAPYNADSEPTTSEELSPISLSRKDNYYTVGESIDPEDWSIGVTADQVYNRVVEQYEKNPAKGIILLHDAGGNREATIGALPRIIAYFKSKGIEFITVAKLLGKTRDEIMPAVTRPTLENTSLAINLIFWIEKVLTFIFWIALILGLFKIFIMGALALAEFLNKKKQIFPSKIFQPPVSIIVPAYNEELNILRTIESLLYQKYPNLEIICIDDGSTDSTWIKLQSIYGNEPRVRLFHKENGGKASALTYGIVQSLREYVVCIDGDTQLDHSAIENIIPYFSDAEIGAVAGNVKV